MSEPLPITAAAAPRADVRGEIARAARRTGVDFNYLLAQARLESNLDPNARAETSSAAGLYQFTSGTWLSMLDRHGPELGLDWAGAAIENGSVRDPQTRSQLLALRYDPGASALMAAELANENRAALSATLGREPDAAELYLAHFLGADGATRFLGALQSDPGQPAATLLPQAAGANRAIFFEPTGAARSLADVMGLIRAKVDSAMEGGSAGSLPIAAGTNGYPAPAGPAPAARPSMAETLRDTFGLASAGDRSGTPGFVRGAYDSLRRFGL